VKKILFSLGLLISASVFAATTLPSSLINWVTAPSAPNQTAKFVFAAPNAAAGVPTFRALLPSDITGVGVTASPLSQFAATTSAQLAGVISDETGSGAAVFANGAAINAATLSASANDALMYANTSAQSIPTGTATTITSWTKVSDRVNTNFNVSTGTFTAPAAGSYLVLAQLTWGSAAGVVSAAYQASIVANGSVVATGRFQESTTASLAPVVTVSALVSLTAGQTIILQATQSSGAAYALTAGAGHNFLSIGRVP
jgi:hypothetical protein